MPTEQITAERTSLFFLVLFCVANHPLATEAETACYTSDITDDEITTDFSAGKLGSLAQ